MPEEVEENQRQKLLSVLENLPGALEAMQAQGISVDNLFSADEVNFFGYGSLPTSPHFSHPGLVVREAVLHGYEKDFCCLSVRSGTKETPGRTLGLLPVSDGLQYGGMLSYSGLTPDEVIECFEAYQKREVVTDLPIYKFSIEKVSCADGKTRYGFVCVADQDSPGYRGDEPIAERAKAEASVYNPMHPALGYPVTTYSYFCRFGILPLRADEIRLEQEGAGNQGAFEKLRANAIAREHDRLFALNEAIQQVRARMPEDQRRKLEEIEYNQAVIDYEAQVKKAPDSPRTQASLEYVTRLAESLGRLISDVGVPAPIKRPRSVS